jgi:hypothetical protein
MPNEALHENERVGYVDERIAYSRPALYHNPLDFGLRPSYGACEKATPEQPNDSFFRGFAAVPDRDGGLCYVAESAQGLVTGLVMWEKLPDKELRQPGESLLRPFGD